MKTLCISTTLFLCTLIFTGSCTGQTNTNAQVAMAAGQMKMIKTRGTNKYASVHCSLQDKAGNVWFGTTGEGIYRYDGKNFKNFTEQDGLSSNSVYCILEDKAGKLWFGTEQGICRYDPSVVLKTGLETFTRVSMSLDKSSGFNSFVGKIPAFTEPRVWSMLQDKSGKIWFGTYNDGVLCYDEKSLAATNTGFTHFLDKDSVVNKSGLQLKAVSAIIQDKNGYIWFTTWFEGVCRYDGQSITNFKPNGEVWFGPLLEDSKGNIWMGRRDHGVCYYDPSASLSSGSSVFTNVLQKGIFDSCGICSIAEDKAGNIWFGAEFGELTCREIKGGLWRYDGHAFQNFTMENGLSNNTVFSICIDKSDRLWLGTRGTGLCSYDSSVVVKAGAGMFTNYTAPQ